ncbi:bifunctional DNA primase/polymerase [Parafrigoribacterium mesophilum]|uniref:bifunctional DNA primase/polymerase n=1 Tax=Parafrigoribacterium mesophilum TaxID=433646 RepID=UPI0031FD3630
MGSLAVFGQVHDLQLSDAAVRLAESLVPVFPCMPGAKRPFTRHGFFDATTDVRQVRRWWDRWPNANIGMPTGGTGFNVVDVDRHPSGSGFAHLERARRKGLLDGWAFIVRTPSGGLHFYYPAAPNRPRNSWGVADAHVDFRGTGGYVVTPPSRIVTSASNSGGYEVIAVGRDPRFVDGDTLRAFLRPPPAPRAAVLDGTSLELSRGRGIAQWLEVRPEGSRNRALFWAACRYAENSIPEYQAHESLRDAAGRAGLPDAEIVATIRSAYRTVQPPAPPRSPSKAIYRGLGH